MQPPKGMKNGVVHSVFHSAVRVPGMKPLVKNPGGLHRSLGVPVGEKIGVTRMRQAATEPGLVGKQARFGLALQGKKY